MPKVSKDRHNNIKLPGDFVERRSMPARLDFWLDERSGSLLLHPILPDIRKIYIEVTTGCNLQCRTCIRNTWSDPQANMTEATFQRLLESMKTLPDLKKVVFTSFGEPLIHPQIMDMIAAVRSLDLDVTIGTNGLLLDDQRARDLIRLGVDKVVISIDGGESETYQSIRGTALKPILMNIRNLNALKQSLHSLFPTLAIEFVVIKSNVAELPRIAKLAEEMNAARVIVSNVLAYTPDMYAEALYSHEPRKAFDSRGWALKSGAWVTWATLDLPHMHWGAERRCRFIQDHATVVGWDGKVAPCYALSHTYSYFALDGVRKNVSRYALGDIHEQSLAETWMSEDYTRFRSEVKVFHFPSCPDCDLRETCDLRKDNEGCWGWNPSCADCLWAQDIVICP